MANPNWFNDPGKNDPAYQKFLRDIVDFQWKSGGFGDPNRTLSEGDIANHHGPEGMYQEIGEGAQGDALLKMFQGGLTADQVNHPVHQTMPWDADDETIRKLNAGELTNYQVDPKRFGTGSDGTWGKVNGPSQEEIAYKSKVQQPLYNHSGQTGADTGAITYDPNRGFSTSPKNFHHGGWETVSDYLPQAIMAGLTAGAGSIIGAGTAASMAMKAPGMAQNAGNMLSTPDAAPTQASVDQSAATSLTEGMPQWLKDLLNK